MVIPKFVRSAFFAVTFALSLGFIASPAMAESLDLTGLNAEQIKELTTKAEQMKTNATTTLEKFSEYAEIGKAVGAGIAATARELGVAVNEFADSDVGRIALWLIIYKLVIVGFAGTAIYYLLGITWTVVVVTTWKHYFNKICLEESRTERRDPETGKVVSTEIEYHSLDDSNVATYRFMMFILLVISLLPSLILILNA